MPILLLAALLAQAWQTSFPVDLATLTDQGESAYFVLKPGFQATFTNARGRLVVTGDSDGHFRGDLPITVEYL